MLVRSEDGSQKEWEEKHLKKEEKKKDKKTDELDQKRALRRNEKKITWR
jgi:hypothetical protein